MCRGEVICCSEVKQSLREIQNASARAKRQIGLGLG